MPRKKEEIHEPEIELTLDQQKTLDSLRSVVRSMSSEKTQKLDTHLERALSIISLASQLAADSIELGVQPDELVAASLSKNVSRTQTREGQRSVLQSRERDIRTVSRELKVGDPWLDPLTLFDPHIKNNYRT